MTVLEVGRHSQVVAIPEAAFDRPEGVALFEDHVAEPLHLSPKVTRHLSNNHELLSRACLVRDGHLDAGEQEVELARETLIGVVLEVPASNDQGHSFAKGGISAFGRVPLGVSFGGLTALLLFYDEADDKSGRCLSSVKQPPQRHPGVYRSPKPKLLRAQDLRVCKARARKGACPIAVLKVLIAQGVSQHLQCLRPGEFRPVRFEAYGDSTLHFGAHLIEQLLLVTYVVVQSRRFYIEATGHCTHSDATDARLIEHVERGLDDPLSRHSLHA